MASCCGGGDGFLPLLRIYATGLSYGPRIKAAPLSSMKFTVTDDAIRPSALMKMNCVVYPPPSAICGKTIGVGAGCVRSAAGNVVSRKSPRPFVSDRSVSVANGELDVK